MEMIQEIEENYNFATYTPIWSLPAMPVSDDPVWLAFL